jgi:hypothetical protein
MSEVSFQAPKPSLSERINVRMIVFFAVVALLIGAPFYIWLRSALSGGIIRHGDYSDVDLKAMSTFDMDQTNGQITDVPSKWRALDGTRVKTVGETWSPLAADGKVTYFQIVYSKTKCCFSGPPLAQHFVECNVMPSASSDDYSDRVSVEGTLHVRIRKDVDKNSGVTVIKSVYQIDVDKIDPIS